MSTSGHRPGQDRVATIAAEMIENDATPVDTIRSLLERDPYPVYAQLRAVGRVFWQGELRHWVCPRRTAPTSSDGRRTWRTRWIRRRTDRGRRPAGRRATSSATISAASRSSGGGGRRTT